MARALRIWAVASLAAAVLVAAGCGGSSSSSGSATASAPANSSVPASSTTSSSTTSSGTSDFCNNAKNVTKDLQSQLTPITSPSATPERLKANLAAIENAYARVIAIAPDAIKPDLEVLSGAFKQLDTAYAKANYNPAQAMAALVPLLNDQSITKAADHLSAWAKTNCAGVSAG
jgi:hypothetical protein